MGRSGTLWRACRRAFASSVASALIVGGCSSGPSPARAAGTAVHVTERDFHISVMPARVSAGAIVLVVANRGPENHELIVVRAASRSLPLRTDGVTADEEALASSKVGALEPGAPGKVRELRFRLA